MRVITALWLLLLVGSACTPMPPTSTEPQNQVDAATGEKRARGLLKRLKRYIEPTDDLVERYERRVVFDSYFGYDPHGGHAKSFLNEMPEEAELKALGTSAVGPIITFLGSTSSNKLKVRLFPLLGILGDPSSLSFLLNACKAESDPSVRRAAVRGIGLLGRKEAIQPVLRLVAEGRVSLGDGAWVLAKCGNEDSADVFCNWVSNSLRGELLEPTLKPPRVRQPVEKPAKRSPSQVNGALAPADDLDRMKDLANLADLEVPRVIALLIECLRHKDHRFQHLAATLFKSIVESRIIDVSSLDCESLQTSSSYLTLRNWWNKKGSQVSWAKERRIFVLE